jgi:hypothetical protein
MVIIALLLAASALIHPAWAQPADCPTVPIGPPVNLQVYAAAPGRSGILAGLGLAPTPMFGTRCVAPAPPTEDVLRGPPSPYGLLQGVGPRDVLHNSYEPEVLVGPPLASADALPE